LIEGEIDADADACIDHRSGEKIKKVCFMGVFVRGNEFACMEWNGMDMYDVKNEKYIYIYMYISLM